jgi:hypothetical protein
MAGGPKKHADSVLVLALAGGASCRAAAKKARVSERTVRRRLAQDTDFVTQVRAARALLLRQSVARLAGAGAKAARTLASLCGSASEVVRLAAARAILQLLFSGFPVADFADEMAELRAMMEALRRQDQQTPAAPGWWGATADAAPTPPTVAQPSPTAPAPSDGLADFFAPGGAQ